VFEQDGNVAVPCARPASTTRVHPKGIRTVSLRPADAETFRALNLRYDGQRVIVAYRSETVRLMLHDLAISLIATAIVLAPMAYAAWYDGRLEADAGR
jgi:hypothetical protein